MRRCPFYALAEDSPQVICTLHHGIIDGALAEAGSEQTVERLEPFVEPGLCIAHLR
jgi:predicted ArsR family transcriptional regulator